MVSRWAILIGLTCSQVVYDGLYKTIIRRAMTKPVTEATYKERNDAIEVLRALCRGQRSTYEKEYKKN